MGSDQEESSTSEGQSGGAAGEHGQSYGHVRSVAYIHGAEDHRPASIGAWMVTGAR